MALSGGHWLDLAEVKKLTSATYIPGVIDEDIKRGNPFTLFPLAQANHTGSSIKWLRSGVTPQGDVVNYAGASGATRVWTDSVTYVAKEIELRSCNLSRLLNKFDPAIYGTWTNYEDQMLLEMMDGIKKAMGDKMIYDDYTYSYSPQSGSEPMDGLHAIAAEQYGSNWDIDEGEGALSIANLKQLIREMKHGIDFFLVPFWLPDRISDAMQQTGWASLISTTAGTMGSFVQSLDSFGKPVMSFAGIPLIPSDFLVAEQANTGISTTARAKYSSGTAQYSIFAIKLGTGSLMARDPGIKLAFGQTEEDGDFFNLEYFSQLETRVNTKGMGISAHTAFINGSSMAVGRIWDITDAAITA